MDNRSRNIDREDAVHPLSHPATGRSLQVLRGPVQCFALNVPEPLEESERGRGRSYGSEPGLDMIDRCQWCNAPLPEGVTVRRTYCSSKCKNDETNAAKAEERRQARAGRTCPVCSGPVSDDRRADAVCCSPKCSKKASYDWHKQKRIRACEACGQSFNACHPRQRFCCLACRTPKPIARRCCEGCGVVMVSPKKAQRFCGRSCSTKALWAAGGMKLPPRAFRGKGAIREK